jgi:hypothetical protein
MDDSREMYSEINALVGAIAKAFEIEAEAVVRAIETGQIGMAMETDANGQPYVAASYQGKAVKVYQGAIKYAPEGTPATGE